MPPKKSDAMSLSLNEKILCCAGGHFYEAMVIEVGTNKEEDEPEYLVHYRGWHKRHDEWINQSNIPEKVKPFSEEALAQAKAEIREAKALLKKRTRKRNLSTASEEVTNSPGMKRKAEDDPVKDPFPRKSDLCLQLPTELKNILIEDGDLINQQSKIYNIPAKYTVERIINDFCQEVCLDRNEQDIETIKYDGKELSEGQIQKIESILGVQDYFDSLLQDQLLYKMENLQYSNAIEKKKREVQLPSNKKRGRSVPNLVSAEVASELVPSKLPSNKKRGRSVPNLVSAEVASELVPSKFYGFPHFLRLLTRFEDLLKLLELNDESSAIIMKSVNDFTVWLNKKKDVYYNSQMDYIVPSLEYQREAYA